MVKVFRDKFTPEQKQLQRVVQSLGLETVLEFEVDGYKLDIFLPEFVDAGYGDKPACGGKALEYDGPMHGFSKKRDRRRDDIILKKYQIDILRVNDLKDPRLVDDIRRFLGVYKEEGK